MLLRISSIGLVASGLALAGCGGGNSEPPSEPMATNAAAGTECVKRAGAAFGVDLKYVTVSSVGEDPGGVYSSAIKGTVERSAGLQSTFYCRLNANQEVVDIVTLPSGS